jgi:hypothetical protein
MKATDFLLKAVDILAERGENRDSGQERSMAAAVGIYETMLFDGDYGVPEQQGWAFMVALKLARLRTSKDRYDREDCFVDLLGYVALWAECDLAEQPDDEDDSSVTKGELWPDIIYTGKEMMEHVQRLNDATPDDWDRAYEEYKRQRPDPISVEVSGPTGGPMPASTADTVIAYVPDMEEDW